MTKSTCGHLVLVLGAIFFAGSFAQAECSAATRTDYSVQLGSGKAAVEEIKVTMMTGPVVESIKVTDTNGIPNLLLMSEALEKESDDRIASYTEAFKASLQKIINTESKYAALAKPGQTDGVAGQAKQLVDQAQALLSAIQAQGNTLKKENLDTAINKIYPLVSSKPNFGSSNYSGGKWVAPPAAKPLGSIFPMGTFASSADRSDPTSASSCNTYQTLTSQGSSSGTASTTDNGGQ